MIARPCAAIRCLGSTGYPIVPIRLLSEYVFSAKGASFILSLGQRPRNSYNIKS